MNSTPHTEPMTQPQIAALHDAGEHLAAGYFSQPDEPPVVRFALAVASHLAHVDLPQYSGEPLYPCSQSLYERETALRWHYSSCLSYHPPVLERKLETCTDPRTGDALETIHDAFADYPAVGGYTHSIPNYRRILREGLAGYRERIERTRTMAKRRDEADRRGVCRAMDIVLDGVAALHRRIVAHIEAAQLESDDAAAARDALLASLRRVPMQPARTFYDAMVAVNFILYVDGPDNLGRFDQDLWPYYHRDKADGKVTEGEALNWIRRLWQNIDVTVAWNTAIGGIRQDGTSAINDLTHLCVKAAEGMRRPNLALRLHKDAPDSIWQAALDCIATGCGLPALYNEEAYIDAIRDAHLGVTETDLPDYAFGGCTELMVHGKSNVGSLEGDLNLPKVLVKTLHDRLRDCQSFSDLVSACKHDFARYIRTNIDSWNDNQRRKARWQPQVIRSLLIDDCIDNGIEYNAGGARYNWSVVNVMGLANVADSLAAVREVVYDRAELSAPQLLSALDADFEGHEGVRRRLQACPQFGNDDPAADDIAADISRFVFEELRGHAPWRGGRFVPACLMFVTYAHFGEQVGATPDGRKAGEPIADSAGAMQGRDTSGPTALLQSVSKLDHKLAPGTLIVNARFSKKYFRGDQQRAKLRDLIETYFELGGMQLQINVVDQEVLRDAYEHPENYGDLIIRVGGYSEYWTRLDDALRRSILQRVEHE